MLPSNLEYDPKFSDKLGVFKDRQDAGNLLAEKLFQYDRMQDSVIVVAIPSGGVPVGYVVAKKLRLSLDIVLVRKIPIPWEPEAGFGSVTFDGSVYLNHELLSNLSLTKTQIAKSIADARKGLERRAKKFDAISKGHILSSVTGKVVLLIDDGLATGYSMFASVESIRRRDPSKIIVTVPTASLTAIYLVSPKVDKLLVLNMRTSPYFAVAEAYQEWRDIPEEEALRLYTDALTDT